MNTSIKQNIIMLKSLGDNLGVYIGTEHIKVSSELSILHPNDVVVFTDVNNTAVKVSMDDEFSVPAIFYFVGLKNIIAIISNQKESS